MYLPIDRQLFGDIIRRLRVKANLRQWELADEIGVATHTISLYENSRLFPGPETLEKLARTFGIPTTSIYAMATPVPNNSKVQVVEAMRELKILTEAL